MGASSGAMIRRAGKRLAVVVAGLCLAGAASAAAPRAGEFTPTGQILTPTAAPGAIFQPLNPDLPDAPDYTAGQASAVALSPDGKTLLILTSGFNRMFGTDGKTIPDQSTEFVFVYDVRGPAPVKRQVIPVADTFIGLAFAPAGDRFFVSGGVDDRVMEYVAGPNGYRPGRVFALGHRMGLGLAVQPEAAGLAVSPDGRRLLVANVQNDSVSLIDLVSGAVVEQDLRPGIIDPRRAGASGGTFPRAVAWVSDTKAYVGCERDREIIALRIEDGRITPGARVRTSGQPVALLAGPRGRLYAALDNTDAALVLDTALDRVVETIPTAGPRPPGRPRLGGAGSNALALSPDGRTLLVANGGENAVAFVALDAVARGEVAAPAEPADEDGDGDDDDKPAAGSKVVGLAPTGWYPTGVAVRRDGREVFVVNGKSNTGSVPLGCRNSLETGPHADDTCRASNQYVWQREKAGFLAFPAPSASRLAALTRQVEINNHVLSEPSPGDRAKMAFLRAHIHHVIYIVKENRTYDQILGDLEVGNGDPRLAVFGRAMTPNFHALARQFVDLDAFFDSGESSNTGWNWTLAGRTNDWTEREAPVNYAGRGLQYDQEGDNRNVNVGFATSAERVAASPLAPKDPNVLAGARDVAAPDGPDGAQERGYLWDQALDAGLSVRNYGFYGDLSLYEAIAGKARTPLLRDPFKEGVKVFTPAKASLMGITDPYFRGFDQAFPDYWRFMEWKREFDAFAAAGKAPDLMMLRLPHDHTGAFGKGLDGVDTVEAELADNDYAVGMVVEAVAKSPFAADTLIFIVEDDAQDGPDHVDAHRAPAFIVGPYVKHRAVISKRHTTVDLVATIEAVLGLEPMGLNDALAQPMADVFDTAQADWTFEARPSEILRRTALPLPAATAASASCPMRQRSGAYWAAAMAGQDFSREDHLDTAAYNLALWRGMKGAAPYPAARDGNDLRRDRTRLIAAAGIRRCPAAG
jgi:DNA-binding beta-propeller fold protein YncE